MSAIATLANLSWLATSIPAHRRFARALRNPRAAQASWLRSHLEHNAGTAYGRAHRLGTIGNYQEFARRVPIVDYEELQPWIDRIRRGDAAVLTREPVTRLMPTSGSTSARKLIPFTSSLQREFNAAISPWIVDLFAAHPTLALGSAYWSVTPLTSAGPPEESAISIGFDDDSEYLGGLRSRFVAGAMAVPPAVRHMDDLVAFRRTVLLHLLRHPDLRLISVWHPSLLSLLLDTLIQDWDTLLASLKQSRADPRVRELDAADPTRPTTVWPKLRVVSCWADAHAEGPAADLQRRLPGVVVQAKGLLATEAFVTLPFRGHHPVAIRSHFFEFIDDNGGVHPVEELRIGKSYEIVVTTGGGLWRYRLGDRVEVIGFLSRTPSLRFLGRAGNVSDRCGEKLSEAFVTQILRWLCPHATFAMLAPESDRSGWSYTLFLRDDAGSAPAGTRLDEALQSNPNYALCRRLGQLNAPRIVHVRDDAYARFTAAEMSRGLRLGDIKPVALSSRTDWAEKFAERVDADGAQAKATLPEP